MMLIAILVIAAIALAVEVWLVIRAEKKEQRKRKDNICKKDLAGRVIREKGNRKC